MKTAYEKFAALLETETAKGKDFPALCKLLGVSPVSLEEVLLEELGMTGQEVVDKYFGIGHEFS